MKEFLETKIIEKCLRKTILDEIRVSPGSLDNSTNQTSIPWTREEIKR